MKFYLFSISAWALGIVAVLLVYAVFTGKSIPYLSGDKKAFLGLAVIGLAMCSFGITRRLESFNWLSPYTLAAAALGILALVLVYVVAFGKYSSFIPTSRAAMLWLMTIIVVKVTIVIFHDFLAKSS